MYTHDVVQIVDVYQRYYERGRQTMKTDPDVEAQSLSMLIKPLGRNDYRIAIIAQGDEPRLDAYQRAGYETRSMNGDRRTELMRFIRQMTAHIKQAPPKHLVVVSDDPEFVHLCDAVERPTQLTVWTSGNTPPRDLTDPAYNWRPLEELLPNLKVARIDIRVDLENIFIGLVKRGWQADLRELIGALRRGVEDLGEIITITGYADFDELNRHHGGQGVNWQRELTLAGGESRYVVNQHGKNTADMKIADDIRTLVEHDPIPAGGIDIVALATMDRDFRPIVETARQRGKKVVVLALEGGLSRELERAATHVRYIDRYLKLANEITPGAEAAPPPELEDVALMLRIAASMQRNRWRFIYEHRLDQEFGDDPERLQNLIAEEWLIPSSSGRAKDAEGSSRALEPNPNKTAARAAHYLAHWIPSRLDYCLNQRGMPHVDSNYLAKGMARDATLTRLDVGQTRSAVENWLCAAEKAGLIISSKQPHSENPSKLITTWRLPGSTATKVEVSSTSVVTSMVTSGRFRQMLTQRLNDSELTTLLFDYFRPVHQQVEGAPKAVRIQALLDHVERFDLQVQLLAAIREINPAVGDESEVIPIAA